MWDMSDEESVAKVLGVSEMSKVETAAAVGPQVYYSAAVNV